MSDSIDRVFVKAISTIRTLSTRTGYGSLPRPPLENRIKLYGLYKQSTEGNISNISNIIIRPIGNSIEDENAQRKFDAWKQYEGLNKTEAKRLYINYLINTMRIYGSGTLEARELLSELEFLWDQIKDIKPSPTPSINHNNSFQFNNNSIIDHKLDNPSSSALESYLINDDYEILKREIININNKIDKIYDRLNKFEQYESFNNNGLIKKLINFAKFIYKYLSKNIIIKLIYELIIIYSIINFIKIYKDINNYNRLIDISLILNKNFQYLIHKLYQSFLKNYIS